MNAQTLCRIVVFLIALMVIATNSLLAEDTSADSIAGTYKSDELSLTVTPDGDKVKGTLHFGGVDYSITATRSGNDLNGTFGKDDDQFDFTAKLAGNTLTFLTADTTYELSRVVEKKNPLAKSGKPNPLAKSQTLSSLSDPTKGWKSYKHPTGLMIKYPPDWTAQEHDAALQLFPPSPARNESGPAEVYLVTATNASGFTSPSDDQVTRYIELQVTGIVPFLKRKDKVESVPALKTPGTLLTFEGNNATGKTIQAQVFTTILKGFAISLVVLGEKRVVTKRDTIVRALFGTVSDTEAQMDPALVGHWHSYTYSSSADGKFGTEHDDHVILAADGTVTGTHRGETSGSVQGKNALGAETLYGGVGGARTNGNRGHWSAGGGKLYIEWNDGVVQAFEYTVSGMAGVRRVNVRPVGSAAKPLEWAEE